MSVNNVVLLEIEGSNSRTLTLVVIAQTRLFSLGFPLKFLKRVSR